MSINLSRNTRLWVSTVNTGHDNSNTFEIPIQDGYSLGQSTASTDVTVDEAGPKPTRGSKRFNTNQDPVEWSFSTYIMPYLSGSNVLLVDMLLWQGLAVSNATAVDFLNASTTSEVFGNASKFAVGFNDNSAHKLKELYMYFLIDNQMYLVTGTQVGQAEISVDISDIAQVSWSGQGLQMEAIATPAFANATGASFDTEPTTVIPDSYVAIPANKNYLVNKLTVMDVNADVAPGVDDFYNVPITGASVSINNNITYLTPETLAEVDKPIGSFTGTFDVSGNIDAYLRATNGAGTQASPYGTAELLDHMLVTGSEAVTNAANLVFNIGGKTTGEPGVVITIPTAQLSVPDFSVEDVISSSMEFKGIPASEDLVSGSEVFLDFYVANP